MYQAGDWIVYGSTGVCRVEAVAEPGSNGAPRGADPARRYYVLRPLYLTETIYTPADNPKVFMRPVISKQEAERLIDQIPQLEIKAFHADNMQQLREHYQKASKSQDCADLLRLTMSIYQKKRDLEQMGRKFWQVDEQYMHRAEELLHGEFSVALGIPKEEVQAYIAGRVKQAGAQSDES